jgi:SNF2 family DNA or RNA helicase
LNNGKLGVIQGLLKLRQLCNSGELLKGDFPACNHSIKTDVLVEEIKNIVPNHKALVFSQFTTMLDLLEKAFRTGRHFFLQAGWRYTIARRQELVNSFQLDSSHESVFLISLKAGGAGLNLTAADYVFCLIHGGTVRWSSRPSTVPTVSAR